jgi:hypothetical protein
MGMTNRRVPESSVVAPPQVPCDQKLPSGNLTKQTLAAHYGVSVRTVENWMALGMPFRNPTGRCVRFSLPEIEHWMAGRTKAIRQVRVRAKHKFKTAQFPTDDLPAKTWSGSRVARRMTVFPNSENIVEDRRLLNYVWKGTKGTVAR